ncbi:MAG: glycosyl hydrolase family 28-related protein, partial [Bacteroidales bacterium]|nr:glycosyl hydrolase family 28-related protein [Bacteroidales bacterium]
PWGADVNFYKNIYNVRTDARLSLKAKGDGVVNDRAAIQQAIDKANAEGGGVVYFPQGKYKLEFGAGCGLTMRSNVVLKGDGVENSVIQFGFEVSSANKDGMPEEVVKNVVFYWPLGTQLSGLSGLCIQDVNKNGLWMHCFKTTSVKDKHSGAAGSGFFAVNCRFELPISNGLAWSYVDKMAIVNCDIRSYGQKTWPWLLHFNGSTNVVVRDNRIRYAAGRFGFNDSYNGIIENNHFTRLGDLQTFKGETGGFNIDYSKDFVVMKNRMDVEGASIADKNQGETILSQGCNPGGQTLGIVTEASSMSINDSKANWPKFGTNQTFLRGEQNTSDLFLSNSVAIVSGKGAGQWRYITGNTATTMQLDRPWDVIPDKGSEYVVMKWSAEDFMVKDNILEGNNRGIWFYGGGNDVVIEGNQLNDSEGIYLRSDQRLEAGRYNLIWNFLVENNRVSRFLGKRPAHICSVLAVQKTHPILGIGTLGVEIRRNLVQTKDPNAASFVTGEGYWNEVRSSTPDALGSHIGVLGTIFDKNTAVGSKYGYRLSKSISQTVIKDPTYVDVPDQTNESTFPESSKIGTVIFTEKDKPAAAADPFIPYLTGKAPRIIKELGEVTENGIRVRKLVFQSYDVQNGSKKDSAVIFAVIARPEKAGNYPGLLVLHGGGGNAEIDKAKKWAALGYVAVAVDEPGIANFDKTPFTHGPWEKYKNVNHRFLTKPDITYCSVFSGVLASVQGLYLLNDQKDVIKDKIGVVGCSWGGYMTAMVSGLANPMIRASFSVFGSGCYDDGSVFQKNLDTMNPWDRALWLKYLDAGRRAASVKTPFFIAAATNDNWFYPPAVISTLNNLKGQTNHLFSPNTSHKIDLPGGTENMKPEQPGWLVMEQVYFDYYLKGIGKALPKIMEIQSERMASGNMLVKFKVNNPNAVTAAQVCYSPVGVEWTKRKWEIVQVPVVSSIGGWFQVELPVKDLRQSFECYATVSDARPVSVSSLPLLCK